MTLLPEEQDYSFTSLASDDDDFDKGIVILSYENIREVYHDLASEFAKFTFALDLTANDIRDLSFLRPFHKLESLVLDKNKHLDPDSLPHLKSLRILWLNECGITDSLLTKWTEIIASRCPQIKFLSMMNNNGSKSMVNLKSTSEDNKQYRKDITSKLNDLEGLDEAAIVRLNDKNYQLTCPKLFEFNKTKNNGKSPLQNRDPDGQAKKKKWRKLFKF